MSDIAAFRQSPSLHLRWVARRFHSSHNFRTSHQSQFAWKKLCRRMLSSSRGSRCSWPCRRSALLGEGRPQPIRWLLKYFPLELCVPFHLGLYCAVAWTVWTDCPAPVFIYFASETPVDTGAHESVHAAPLCTNAFRMNFW